MLSPLMSPSFSRIPRGTMRRALMGAISVSTVAAAEAQGQDRSQSRSMVSSPLGVVASESVLASQVGARILEQGGNAIDAAVATNAMMGLVAPMNDGPILQTVKNSLKMQIMHLMQLIN